MAKPPSDDLTLFFCIGAQKAGTSWLHDYLKSNPEVHVPQIKELHHFDTLHLPRIEGSSLQESKIARTLFNIQEMSHLSRSLRERPERPNAPTLWNKIDFRSRMIQTTLDPTSYTELLQHGRREERVVGETTPAYALLDRIAFNEMSRVSPKTKFIFIMRDPVKRLWSQARMETSSRIHNQSGTPDDHFMWLLDDPKRWKRSNYLWTITELEAVVPQEDILILFYEDLFSESRMQEVCSFLGIGYLPPQFEKRPNLGRQISLPPDHKKKAQATMSDVYSFVRKRWGTEVPDEWS